MFKGRRSIADKLVTLFVVAFFVFAAVYFLEQKLDAFGYAESQSEYENQSQGYRLFGLILQRHDTLAQWIMAIFTVVAAALLYATFHEANKTNQSAIKAANAASEANEIMRREQRPWLTFEPLDGGEIRFHERGANSRIPYKIKNRGKSPAFNAILSANIMHYTYPRALKHHLESYKQGRFNEDDSGRYRVIFPGDEIDISMGPGATHHFNLGIGGDYALVTIITYQLDQSDAPKVAWEGRAYRIIELDEEFNGFRKIVLSEYSSYRITR